MKICKICQQPFDEFVESNGNRVDPDAIGASLMGFRRCCWPCSSPELENHTKAEEAKETQRRRAAFIETVPPIYRGTDLNDPRLNPAFVKAAEAWNESGDRGLGFVGASGGGKTRLLFECLRRAHEAGRTCHWISHNRFSHLVIDRFGSGSRQEEAAEHLDRIERAGVLFIDDLGKAPSTDRCDADLFELIETRGTHNRPTLWSCNASSVWLEAHFGPDRGAPIVRRLAEFSTVIKA